MPTAFGIFYRLAGAIIGGKALRNILGFREQFSLCPRISASQKRLKARVGFSGIMKTSRDLQRVDHGFFKRTARRETLREPSDAIQMRFERDIRGSGCTGVIFIGKPIRRFVDVFIRLGVDLLPPLDDDALLRRMGNHETLQLAEFAFDDTGGDFSEPSRGAVIGGKVRERLFQ